MSQPRVIIDSSEIKRTESNDPLAVEYERRATSEGKSQTQQNRGSFRAFFNSLRGPRNSDSASSLALSPAPSIRSEARSTRGMKSINVRTHKTKKVNEFNNLFHAQALDLPLGTIDSDGNLQVDTGRQNSAVWTMEFSPDGMYLAAGGADKVVWVWTLLTRRHDEESEPSFTYGYGVDGITRSAVFAQKPIRMFMDHTADILSLAWSSTNFLLSSSIDTTVRLWHVEREGCLGVFSHPDIVTSVAFHPIDNRFFLSGSLDRNVRLWSLPDKEVVYERQTADMVTAVSFSPSGTLALAGRYDGNVLFFKVDNLELVDTLQVTQRSKGNNKITGLRMYKLQDGPLTRYKILVTGNNSRIRAYDYDTMALECKYKGATNDHSQAIATASPDLERVICSSEDGRVYIWNCIPTEQQPASLLGTKDNFECESFRPAGSASTCALFAPVATKRLLFGYHDPVYRDASSASSPPVGRLEIIVTADTKGRINIYRQAPLDVSRRSTNRNSWRSIDASASMFSVSSYQGPTTGDSPV